MSSIPFLVAVATAVAFFIVRALVIAGGAAWWVHKSRFAQLRRVYRRAYAEGQLRKELRAAVWVVVLDAVILAGMNSLELLRFGRPGVGAAVVQFILFALWFELWFYVSHRALHSRRLYFLHAQHHVAKVTHPLTSLSFSLGERVLLTGGGLSFVALAGQLWPFAFEAVGAYFFLNYLLNVMGHTNVELFPAGFGRSWLGKVFFSVSFHAMHHARYTGHYGLFTTVLDRMFGSAWDDYPEVQARAARGEGLETLGARLPVTGGTPQPAPVVATRA